MTDDRIFSAALNTLATLSYVHRNLVHESRNYTNHVMMLKLEEMIEERVNFLYEQKGQVTNAVQPPTPNPEDEMPF